MLHVSCNYHCGVPAPTAPATTPSGTSSPTAASLLAGIADVGNLIDSANLGVRGRLADAEKDRQNNERMEHSAEDDDQQCSKESFEHVGSRAGKEECCY
jgi:hypothetical protein